MGVRNINGSKQTLGVIMASTKTLSSLLQNSTLDDHEEILKTANGALKKSKTDTQSHYIRVIALLKLDRYEDALRAIEEGGDALKNEARTEWAYALYKTGQLDEAQKIVSAGQSTEALRHLEGQIAYRAERFPEAASIYKDLASHAHESEESDLRIQRSATDAQLSWNGKVNLMSKIKPDRNDLEQFETAYNAACGYIARGELKQAEMLLNRARDLCNAADELSDNEKSIELIPIKVQQLYVSSTRGEVEKAAEIAGSIKVADISDPVTRHIAQSNVLHAAKAPLNPYMSQRLAQSAPQIPKRAPPFVFQKHALQRNDLTLEYEARKFNAVSKNAESMIDGEHVSLDFAWAGSLSAIARAKGETGNAAIKNIVPLLESRPNDVGLLLTIVQLYLITNNYNTATSLLETFLRRLETSTTPGAEDCRFAPGLVAVLVSLYASQNRIASMKAELNHAASYWRRKPKPTTASLALIQTAAASMLEVATEDELSIAREYFHILELQRPDDIITKAGLLASMVSGHTGTPEAQDAKSKIASIEKLTSGIDIAKLEAAGIARPPPELQPVVTGSKRPADSAQKPSKARKIRKSRIPKDYDPDKKPDPERWLPLRDRSTWKPKKKGKGKALGGTQTQGGLASDDSRPVTPSQTVKAPLQKKKKGKGGR